MKLGNIEIGTKRGYHSLPVDVDNNTSSGFGFAQPLFSKFLEEGEALKLNFTQEVLLSPTVCPSYARMSVHNQTRFVKMCDIFPAFDALLSHLPINGKDANYIPTQVPWLRQRFLLKYIFKYSYVTSYKLSVDGVSGTDFSYEVVLDSVETPVWPDGGVAKWCLEANGLLFNLPYSSVEPYPFHANISESSDSRFVSFDGADFILTEKFPNSTHPTFIYALAIKMGPAARNLYKIFKGLGYSLSMEDNDPLSFLPLLAYYKAWFDSYAPQRFVNWHLTKAYKLVNLFYQTGNASLESLYSNPDLALLFNGFFDDLIGCYYSYPTDYISAHTITPVNDISSTAFSMDFPAGGDDQEHALNDQTNEQGKIPFVGPFASDVLNNYTLKALKFMAKFIQKNSVIGGRISQYIRNHYNMNVSDDMFADSTNLGDFLTECSIDKVLSTADTSQEVNGQLVGEKIGSYAGFGRGMNKYDINFTAPSTGYYIILTSVVPFASYCQGNGNDLYMLDRYTFPSEDFDALGLELTPRHSLIDSAIGIGSDERNKTSFGWIPRMSKYKVFKNILNGCMAFRSTQNSYLPYCFDKIAVSHEIDVDSVKKTLRLVSHDVPNASVEWRYCNKYPWLSMWNRIFYNNGENFAEPFNTGINADYPVFDDNFIIQTRLNGNFRSKLIPLSQSFDLVDDEDDNVTDKVTVD